MEGTEEVKKQGAFALSLKRSNKAIRDDRATAIIDIAEMKFKRKIEDIGLSIKTMKMERDNMLDLSPTTATSLIVASDFDADAYVKKEEEFALKLRNEEIRLELLQARYNVLFVGEEK